MNYATDIFAYDNYRVFFKDWYTECKNRYPFFSLRYIQSKVGYKSPAFFSQIVNNQTRITPDTALKFIKFLGLKSKAADYFMLLVTFDNAKDTTNKNTLRNQILNYKRPIKPKQLSHYHYQYFSQPHNAMIRELITAMPFYGREEELKKICNLLLPLTALTVKMVKETVETLEELELIKMDENGRYTVTDEGPVGFILNKDNSSDPQEQRKKNMVKNQIINFIDLAKNNIDQADYSGRVYRFFAFSVSEDQLQQIRKRCDVFLDEVVNIVNSSNKECDRIYNLNIQLFPLSKKFNPEGE